MRRDRAEPRDAGIAQRDIGIEAAGDRVGDEGAALFGEEMQQPLLGRDERVEARGFAVEVIGDGSLIFIRRNKNLLFIRGFPVESRNGGVV
ncbi:MAG: hypothetical protein ACRD4O_09520 [Bryobacteraceae bacterium]